MDEDKNRQDAGVAEADVKAQTPPEQAEDAQADAPVATEAEWRTALETAVKQRDEYLAAAQRAQADFANYKRRTAQSRTDGYDDGAREVLAAILPVIDNLERAIAAAEAAGDAGALIDGVRMTRKQLFDATARFGLEEIPALGERFDPEVHNAVMRAEEGEPGTVLEVFEKGYRARGRVLRYAMVKVAVE